MNSVRRGYVVTRPMSLEDFFVSGLAELPDGLVAKDKTKYLNDDASELPWREGSIRIQRRIGTRYFGLMPVIEVVAEIPIDTWSHPKREVVFLYKEQYRELFEELLRQFRRLTGREVDMHSIPRQ